MNAEFRGRHLMVEGVRLHHYEFPKSNSRPVILLPGITSPAILWNFVSHRISQSYHVYCLDNRGRGLSQSGNELDYWLSDYARDTHGVIQQLGLDRPIILGHSMGARIGIKLANPESIGALILADPPVSGPNRRPYPIPLDWYLEGLKKASCGQVTERDSPLLKNWTSEQISLRDQWLPTCSTKAITQSHRSFHEEDIHTLMPNIHVSTILMYAQSGGTVLDEDATEIIDLIPDCLAVKIPHVGHMMPWDDLDSFIKPINNFIATIEDS